jgi:serine/threonine protein kinase
MSMSFEFMKQILTTIQMIYVMHDIMVFNLREEQHTNQDVWRPILRLHISYFADEDSLNRLLNHIGQENQFFSGLLDLAGSFIPGDLRRPFAYWHFVQPELRDLVCQMTNLDPGRRITARKALSHPWFRQDS